MNALIIEDEKAALRNLKAAIEEAGFDISIVGETDSIMDCQLVENTPYARLGFYGHSSGRW